MKSLTLFSALIILSSNANALDDKKCIMDKINHLLQEENSCETLEDIGRRKVQKIYTDCRIEFLNNKPSIEELRKVADSNYDREIQNAINKKIQDCGYTGSVKIEEKGVKGFSEIVRPSSHKQNQPKAK